MATLTTFECNDKYPLAGIVGRIRDMDSHEMTPAYRWAEDFGPETAAVANAFLAESDAARKHPNTLAPLQIKDGCQINYDRDETPLSADNVDSHWGSGCRAAGAFDLSRRLDFMDFAGIGETLLFGSGPAIMGQLMSTGHEDILRTFKNVVLGGSPREAGLKLVKAHNDWCIRAATAAPGLRPAACVLTSTLKGALEESESLAASGIKAVMLWSSQPIGGKAPAHPDNDVLWKFYADNKIAVVFHVGGEFGFLAKELEWINAPAFAANVEVPTELNIDPFTLATIHFAPVNYLTNLVLGGVFERVPELRVGIAELQGHWVGQTADSMDYAARMYRNRMKGILSMPPSEYIKRNVRVQVFASEPIDEYLERYPQFADVYCFGSDYPHVEGGRSPIKLAASKLERLGPDVMEKFFVKNAEWIMPG